jgi:hypothetical protein
MQQLLTVQRDAAATDCAVRCSSCCAQRDVAAVLGAGASATTPAVPSPRARCAGCPAASSCPWSQRPWPRAASSTPSSASASWWVALGRGARALRGRARFPNGTGHTRRRAPPQQQHSASRGARRRRACPRSRGAPGAAPAAPTSHTLRASAQPRGAAQRPHPPDPAPHARRSAAPPPTMTPSSAPPPAACSTRAWTLACRPCLAC